MRRAWVVALLAAATLGGCTADAPTNPNLSAPKLVLHARPDGFAEVFVHGAFNERLYSWIALAIDNETRANRTTVFSLEETVNATGFYFEASAGTTRESYFLRGRADVDSVREEVHVALLDAEGEWSDAQTFGLPFERVLVRRGIP